LFYVAIVPVILTVLMQRLVPEPEAWVKAKAAERAAGKAVPDSRENMEQAGKRESVYKLIFGDPLARNMFIFWCLTAGFLQFGYYGVNNWMPAYLETELNMNFKSMTSYLVGTYTAMILGK